MYMEIWKFCLSEGYENIFWYCIINLFIEWYSNSRFAFALPWVSFPAFSLLGVSCFMSSSSSAVCFVLWTPWMLMTNLTIVTDTMGCCLVGWRRSASALALSLAALVAHEKGQIFRWCVLPKASRAVIDLVTTPRAHMLPTHWITSPFYLAQRNKGNWLSSENVYF